MNKKIIAVAVLGLFAAGSAHATGGTYMPDVVTLTGAMADEAKSVGGDMFAKVFPVIGFFAGLGVAVAIFKKLVSKLGG